MSQFILILNSKQTNHRPGKHPGRVPAQHAPLEVAPRRQQPVDRGASPDKQAEAAGGAAVFG